VTDAGPVARAAELAALGHRAPVARADVDRLASAATHDPDPRVRAAALGALVRGAPGDALTAWAGARTDPAPAVRRRVAELAPAVPADPAVVPAVLDLLDDADVTVVEAAAWAVGELGDLAIGAGAVARLAGVVRDHRDALAREAAVAALGALGDPDALPVILAACRDKPAVRRRAVLALAPFDGPEVDAAIAGALDDRDWQVRQAAEDLRDEN
jgi:HEAT repeat protein